MRIRRLDLLKFGPFTDQSLSFSEGNFGLHLVYGPNEAGKTSTLRALHHLLFGIPGEKKCQDSFLHQYDRLRIGAELESTSGDILELIRRKGGKATSLRGPDDRSKVAPESLADLLGRIDAARFSAQFGIDYDQLRAGGAGIIEGGGDVGTSLFAAGAGQANFAAILKSLNDDCEKLFKERGRNQHINSGLSRLADAHKTVRQTQLSEAKWSDQRKALEQNKKKRDQLLEELQALQVEHGRLDSFQKSLPLIGELRDLQERLRPLAEVPRLREDFAEMRRNAATECETAKGSAQREKERIDSLKGEIDELSVPEDILANAAVIEGLSTDLGRYRERLAELPKLKARREHHVGNIARLTSELGLADAADRAADHSINIATRQGIRDLAADASGINQSVQSAKKQLQDTQKELNAVTKELNDAGTASDTRDLDAAIERIQKYGDLEEQRDDATDAAERVQQQLEIDLQQKLQWPGTIAEVERLSVPSAATVSTFEQQFADAVDEQDKRHERLSELNQELAATEGALKRISLGHDVPTEEDLAAARKLRDDIWDLVRQKLNDGVDEAAVSEFLAARNTAGDLFEAYEQTVGQADQVADRLRREAEKVAEKSQLIARQHELQKNIDRIVEDTDAAASQLEQLSEQWQEAWESASIVPRHPQEMAEWLRDHSQILKEAAALRDDRLAIESFTKKIDASRDELSGLLQKLTGDDHTDNSLEWLLDFSRQVSADVERQAGERSRLEREVTRLTGDKESAEEAVSEAEELQAKWQKAWSSATASLGSDQEISPSQAGKLLDAFDDLTAERGAIERLDTDISDFESALAEFESAAKQLMNAVEFAATDSAVSVFVSEVTAELSRTRTSETRRSEKQKQLEEAQQDLDGALNKQQQAEVTLRELCREAGRASVEELPAIESDWQEFQKVDEHLTRVRSQLQQLAGAESVDEFVQQATAKDSASLGPRLEQLDGEIADRKQAAQDLSESIGSSSNELAKMDGSSDAARAQDEVEQIRARLRTDAEEYVRLKLASSVLKNAVDRYRKQNQGPVLQRASELFQQLTLGAFTELQQDFDDAGKPVICGFRTADESHVGVTGMSEGTCDQLYLALRLATLEVWLDQHDPIPFIVDDILIQFDDDRAAAALKIFAELSKRTQVIMFTHHQHLVDVAQDALSGTDVLSVQTLERVGAAANLRS